MELLSARSAVEPSDEELMASFCAGEEGSFIMLFNRHAERLRRFLLRLTADETLAADLTQTTFLSILRGRHRFVVNTSFRTWSCVIALNALRDHQRRRAREIVSDPASAKFDCPSSPFTESDPLLTARLDVALQALPREQREAIVLHHLEGFSFKEAAQMLGLSESAAKVRAHRGYEKLRALLHNTWMEHATAKQQTASK